MNFSTRVWLLVLLANAGFLSGTAQAQRIRVTLPGESRATADRLAAVDKLVEGKQWPAAVEEYVHILEEAGDDLVPLDRVHCLAARRLCHLRLANLPAANLRLYRERIDTQAKLWLEQGKAERDPRLLRRLVDEAFCSRFTDQAIDLLGDLAFERGRFEEANAWWEMLAPGEPGSAGVRASATGVRESEDSFHLVYPDPQVDLARVRAKEIVAKLFQGDRRNLSKILKAFQAKYENDEGMLAGRKGKYAEILHTVASDPELTAEVERRKSEPQPWSTFAGDSARNFIPGTAPGRLTLESPPWPVRLDGRDADKADFLAARRLGQPSPSPRGPDLGLNYYPAIAGDLVLVADNRSVVAYDLITARRKGKFDLREDLKAAAGDLDLTTTGKGDLGFTVTVADNHLLVRLGTMRLSEISQAEKAAGKRDSYLLCLDLPPADGKFVLRWFQSSNSLDKESDKPGALFEGAPMVGDGLAYIARTRVEKTECTTEIDCFDAETGKLRWRQDVCVIQETNTAEPRQGDHLLTLAGSNVVYCCHAGAVIALDARTGKRAWAVRYPSRGSLTETGTPSPRDLAPGVYSSGRVFVAPADFAGILCLDADSGQTIWEKEHVEVVHLLGVAKGRLIFTTGRKPRGIQGVDAATGSDNRKWFQPESEGELPSFGRGFLAGDYVFWPTQPNPYLRRLPSLRVLNQKDGQLPSDIDPEQYWQIQPGNMAFGNGCLAVADQERLYVYVPPGRLLEKRKRDAASQPDSATARYRLAVAEADAGLVTQALDNFAQAERLASSGERWDGFLLRELARSERHRLLLSLAQREWVEKKSHLAMTHLDEAAGAEFSTFERLEALRRKARWMAEANRPEESVAVWQAILDDDSLRCSQTLDGQGRPQQTAACAADQISALIKSHGVGVYQAIEQRVLSELNAVPEKDRSETLVRLGRKFPNAACIRTALLRDAVAQETGNPTLAAQEYRCLLALIERDQMRKLALQGMARTYQEQQRREESIVELKLPLVPRWQTTLAPGEHFLQPVSPCGSRHFFTDGTQLICREVCNDCPCWRRDLGGCPCWVGRHADLVIVAEAESIHCLSANDGRELWRFADPLLRVWDKAAAEADGRTFSQFHLSGGRLFFLQANRRLFAIDAETGRALWTRWAPGAAIRPLPPAGEFVPHFHADSDRVVVQTSAGHTLFLESLTGRTVAEIPSAGDLWPQSPVPIGEGKICTAAGKRRIVSLDLAAGRELWSIHADWPGTTTLAPQLFGDGKALLALIDGWQLTRLNPADGQILWECPTGTEPLSSDQMALDPERVYYVSRCVLHARSLSDGHAMWRLELPKQSVPWKLLAAGDYIVAFPAQAPYQLRWGIFLGSRLMSFPLELRWARLPLLISDKEKGKVVQRMDFPGEGSQAVVHCFGKGLAIVFGDRILACSGAEREKPGANIAPGGTP